MKAPDPRRSVVGAALLVAAGAAWGGGAAAAQAPLAALAAIPAAAAAAFAFLRRRKGSRAAAMASTAALFCFAFSFSALNARARSDAKMRTVELFREALDSREAAFVGRVSGEPSVTALKRGGARLAFDLVPRGIVFESDTVPVEANGLKVRVEWYGPRSMDSDRPPFPLPQEGEGWFVEGRIREIPGRGPVPRIALALRGGENPAHRVPGADAPAAFMRLRDARRAASRALGAGLPRDDAGLALLRAMILGERAEMPPAVSEAFKASGTIHVFAISGLHVGIVANLLLWAFRRLRAPRFVSFALLAAALCAYVALTGWRPSAVRALAMSLLAAGAPLAGRRPAPLLALSGALALLLAIDPLQTRETGFVFSFLCTGAILGLARPFGDIAKNAALSTAAGRKGAAAIAAMDRKNAAAALVAAKAREILSIPHVSLAAWLASAPLTAMVFGRFGPLSVLCNVVVLPLAMLAVQVAIAALALAAVLPAPACAALGVNRLAASCAGAMAKSAELAAAVPGVSLETPPWPPLLAAAWFGALLALCAWLNRPADGAAAQRQA